MNINDRKNNWKPIVLYLVSVAVIIILARPKADPSVGNPPKQAAIYTDGTGKE